MQAPAAPAQIQWTLDLKGTPQGNRLLGATDGLSGLRASLNQSGVGLESANGTVQLSGDQDMSQLRDTLFRSPAAESLNFLGQPTDLVINVKSAADNLTVRLQSRMTTGYIWMLDEGDSRYRKQGDEAWSMRRQGVGSPGIQTFKLRATGEGPATVHLIYRRPFEKATSAPALMTMSVTGVEAMGNVVDLTDPTPVKPPVARPFSTNDKPQPNIPSTNKAGRLGYPASYDSRTAGIVPAVRDQGSCGSCWAFGTVGIMEVALARAGTSSVDLSEQFLVSCNLDRWSCADGGWNASKYHYDTLGRSQSTIGAVLESAKPYTATDSACTTAYDHPYRASAWRFITGSEFTMPTVDQIKDAIMTHGAVSSAVCVDNGWYSYSGSVYAGSGNVCGGGVNHEIVLVGWDDSTQSWILRNSWGTNWGEHGYMRIRYDQTGANSRVGQGAAWIDVAPVGDAHLLNVTLAGTGSGSVSSAPVGIDCGSDCVESYNATTSVTLSAAASGGSTFAGWSGACSGTGACTLAMSADHSVTATFNGVPSGSLADAVDNTSLSWTTGGDGSWARQTSVSHDGSDAAQSGNISDSGTTWMQTSVTGPSALSFYWKVSSESSFDYLRFYIDGVEQTGSISGEVDWRQVVQNIASGNHTLKWAYTKDGSVSLGSDAGWVDQVVFGTSLQYTLTVSKAGSGSGTVASAPAGIDCGNDCTQDYSAGTSVTLTAQASPGSQFGGWSGACTGTGTCTLSMSASRSVTATFSGGGSIPVDCQCSGHYSVGDRVVALVNSPSGASGISAGDHGTVVCGASGSPPLLISWDNWQSGHTGNGYCSCPTGGLPDHSGWYAECGEVSPAGSASLQEALDNTSLTLVAGGDAQWYGQTPVSHDGTDAAQSGDVGDSQSTWMETAVTGPTTLSFYWKVSSESTYDYLRFYIDGVEQTGSISGAVDWQQKVWTIPAGNHTSRWAYTKDESVSSGSDAGWVDQVTLVSDTPVSLADAVDAPGLNWTTGGNASWLGEHVISHDGTDAAQGGGISDNQTTWLQTTVSGPGTLSYYWKVSSEGGWDYLRFYIDGVEQSNITGETAWDSQSWGIAAGSHTLKWAYTKDYSVSQGNDAGWLDQVVYSSGSGSSYTLTVVRLGAGTGQIASDPAGIDCGTACNMNLSSGTSVTLRATTGVGSTFGSWGGACSGLGGCTVVMNTDKSVTAIFSDTGPSEPIACQCDSRYSVGQQVVALVDNPAGSSGISAGTRGTVICGSSTTAGKVLVSWDGWQFGHDGQGHCGCPVTTLPSNSGWFMGCNDIGTGNALTVTPVAGAGGSVSPDTPQSVSPGGTKSFVITADSGYIPHGVEGTCPTGGWQGNTWTTGAMTQSCIVEFRFFCIACLPSGGWRKGLR
ncbi:C1 family peptidase [uncultured Thiodictyon sp.]|uniref:C1 family peptidase n=1 Tax=uncultured Thiodictyon sp. TaxID=1846217 RepID=UPI0025ECABFE|nr:C1 family peptidase [uncultured Thiodictyon sp.]